MTVRTKATPAAKLLEKTPLPVQQQLPSWFDEFISTYTAGTAHCFILSGDIWGTTVQSIPYRRFLQRVLETNRDIVAYYNRAKGITFATESMRQTAETLLDPATTQSTQADPITAAISGSGVGVQQGGGDVFRSARRPLDALALLEQLLLSPRARKRIAVILDFADTLCPAKEKAAMSGDELLLLVTLLSWGQDEDLAGRENPVFLLARDAGELHDDLRYAGSGYKLIEVPPPSRDDRTTYLNWYLQQRTDKGKAITLSDMTITELANLTSGLNLRHLEDILLLAAKSGGVTRALVKSRKDSIIAAEYSSEAEMLDPLPGGFESVGGMNKLIEWARTDVIAPLRAGERDVPKGVLLVGPPGTGKTWFVRALAAEIGFNAVALRAENILNDRVGQSERRLKRFFEFARSLSPTLVFFDELDQSDMSQRGNNSGNPVASNLFNQMLQFMSNESMRGEVLVVFATNRPDLIDPALLRFGRMDAIIPVLLPDENARRGIILAQARGQGIASVSDAALTILASQTNDYSAADLAAVVDKAKKLARRAARSEVGQEEVELALRLIRPATPQIARRYTLMAVQACNDAERLEPPYDAYLSDRDRLQAQIEEIAVPTTFGLRDERSW